MLLVSMDHRSRRLGSVYNESTKTKEKKTHKILILIVFKRLNFTSYFNFKFITKRHKIINLSRLGFRFVARVLKDTDKTKNLDKIKA